MVVLHRIFEKKGKEREKKMGANAYCMNRIFFFPEEMPNKGVPPARGFRVSDHSPQETQVHIPSPSVRGIRSCLPCRDLDMLQAPLVDHEALETVDVVLLRRRILPAEDRRLDLTVAEVYLRDIRVA